MDQMRLTVSGTVNPTRTDAHASVDVPVVRSGHSTLRARAEPSDKGRRGASHAMRALHGEAAACPDDMQRI